MAAQLVDDSSLELCGVVKVYTSHAAPSYTSPWKTSGQWSSVGSALPIPGQLLLTNAHVAANAHLVHVRRSDGHKKFVASVLSMCTECDLALLKVEDPLFWEGLASLEIIDGLPRLQDEVAVIGFPDAPSGGEAVCVTQGVVSRIDLHGYSWDSRLLAVQIDAAINPGNSGGPCIDKAGRVVGVAFQKGVDAGHDNIGYIIPAPIVHRFLECCANKSWGFGAAGFTYSLLDNPSLCELVGLPSGMTGVLVATVDALAPARGLFEPAVDIIVSVDGESVGEDGTVAPTGTSSASRIPLDWMFRRRLPGDAVHVEVLRRGLRRQVRLPLCHLMPLVPADPLDGERRGMWPEYLLMGGLVFAPLTMPLIQEACGRDLGNCPTQLLNLALHGRMEHPGQQVVVLSSILACEFTQGYEVHRLQQLKRCNGQAVRSLAHLASLVSSCTEEFLRFDLADEQVLALRRGGIAEATAAVAKLNHIAETQNLVHRPSPEISAKL